MDQPRRTGSGEPLHGFYPERGGSMGIGPFDPMLAAGGPFEQPGYGHGAGGVGSYGAYGSEAYLGFGGEARGAYGGEWDPEPEVLAVDAVRSLPRGYQRSDEDIREEIVRRMIHDTDTELGEMEVIVDKGHVRLIGEVPTRHDRRVLEEVAAMVRGVSHVENALSVAARGERSGGGIGSRDMGATGTNVAGPGVTGGETESAGSGWVG